MKTDLKKAIIFMLLSTLAFAVMNGVVKYLDGFNAYEKVFFRSLGTLIFTMPYLIYKKIPLLGNKRMLLIARGVIGAISLILFFLSLKYLPVGTAVTLRYLSPIFAAIFAVIWLKETIKPLQWLFFFMALTGVFVLQGFDGTTSLIGLLLVLTSALCMGLVFVVISKIGKQDHPMVIINYFMIIGTVLGGLLALNDWKTPVGNEWFLLLGLGVVGFIGQLFMTKSFQIASTNQVAPLKYLEVIFTVIIGVVWFLEIYTIWSVVGILLVITGLVLNILYKARISK
ncbi:EamA domain-containing membrane protein RarD [Nonlabens dokdonensis]|jgi:drug/metabolite transporter (DMT)-like permease|uniref:EamA domain-containing membrane protein RarD n=2 Tax=Nonlabens dokdonensis TaxID=328515 RepID=A0ABX5PZY0_9FLAO|nr:DMT family transporter [Nonlabens dokdonensis]PZX43154.1 EamA domain-containing membrane protein RarD [Nonlabens dokdonensis]